MRSKIGAGAATTRTDCAVSDPGKEESVSVSVVIPALDEAENLTPLLLEIEQAFTGLPRSYEVIFVDDGSVDASWERLQELKEADPVHISAIQLMRNFGQHNALMCGFRHSCGRLVVTMDDDLQHPPEEIGKLIARIEESGLDLVYGVSGGKAQARWRNLGSWLIAVFYNWQIK